MHYTVDLAKAVKLSWDDPGSSMWIQGFPMGEFSHGLYGDLQFNRAFFRDMESHFRNRIRQIDPDIDYDHKAHDSKAAGWVKDVELRSDGFWLLVEWTPPAYESLKNKEYRYFSPEFGDWEDPKTGTVYHNVLLGGGITNRPFLKELQPINLSEILSSADNNNKGESMKEFLTKLAATLGVTLSEDDSADVASVLAALNAVVTEKGDLATKVTALETQLSEKPGESDEDAKLAKLAETNEAVRKMLTDRDADRKRLSDLEASLRLNETSRQLSEIKIDNKILPPAFITKIAPLLAAAPKALSEEITRACEILVKAGTVQLGEIGSTGGNNADRNKGGTMSDDSYKKFNEAVTKLLSEKPELGYANAAREVGRTNEALWTAYNDSFEGQVN